MTSLVLNQLKKIDLFGKHFIFEENDSQKHNTIPGFIFTILLIASSGVLSFLFGKEIYERKNPIVIYTQETINYSNVESFDYPIVFVFSFGSGANFPNYKDYIDVNTTSYSLNSELTASVSFASGLKTCEYDSYSDNVRKLMQELKYLREVQGPKGVDHFCLNISNYSFQNGYTTRNSSFINVRFGKCDPSMRKCADDLEIKIKDLYIGLLTVDSIFDPNNFTSPISYYWRTYGQQTNNQFLKRNYISIERRKVVTNIGWLLDNYVDEEFLMFKSMRQDLSPILGKEFYQITFDSPVIREKTIRVYLKFQELIAKIGGLASAFSIFCNFLLSNYVNFSYYTSIFFHLSKSSEKPDSKYENVFKKKLYVPSQLVDDNYINLKNNIELSNINNNELKNNDKLEKFEPDKVLNDENQNEKIVQCKNKLINSSKVDEQANYKFEINDRNHRNSSQAILISKLSHSNNFIINNKLKSKTSSKIEENNNKEIKEVEIYDNINRDESDPKLAKESRLVLDDIHFENGKENFKFNNWNFELGDKVYYLDYIWETLLCCRKKYTNKFLAVKKILSFNNITELSFEKHYRNILIK